MADRTVNVALRAEISGFKSAMNQAAQATKQTADSINSSVGQMDKFGNKLSAADVQAGRYVNTAGRVVEANGKFASGFDAGTEAAKRQTATMAQSMSGFEKLQLASTRYADSWQQVSNVAAVGGTAMVATMGLAISKYADFDAAMSNVAASTHESEQNMSALREAAITAGKDTAYSATEAAGAIDELAKAGVSTKDILSGGLKGALDLAAAGQMDVGEAAETAATAMTQFKLSGDQLPHVADLLAAGAGKAQGSVSDMGYALKQSGLVASQAGISIEETTGTLAAFASAGLIGSDAGTSFKSMLQRLQNPSKQAQEALDELGITMYDSQGNFVGMTNLAEQLKTKMQNLTPAQRDAAMATIFGSDAVRAANVLYSQGGQGIQDWINKVNDSGYAAETAALKQDNLKGDLEKLGGAFETIFMTAGGSGNDALRGLVQAATDVLDAIGKIPAPVLETAGAITALGGVALVAGSGVMKAVSMFNAFKDGLSTAKDMASIFKRDTTGLADNIDIANGTMDRGVDSSNKYAGALKAAAGAALMFAASNLDAMSADFTGAFQDGADAAGQFGDNSTEAVNKVNNAFKSADWANGNAGGWSQVLDGTASGVNNVGDAIHYMNSTGGFRDINEGLNDMFGNTTALDAMKQDIQSLDAGMAQLAQGGNLEQAQSMFQQFAEQTKAAGGDVGDLASAFPQLISAVQQYGETMGVSLSQQEAIDFLMGQMPEKLASAAGGAEQASGGFGQLAGAAEEAAAPLKDIMDSLTRLGMAHMSSAEAQGAYAQSVRDMGAALRDNVFQLDETGKKFNVNTEGGYKAQQAFDAAAKAGWDMAEAMANNGASQSELQGALGRTYNDLVNAGTQYGLTAEQAKTLAREVLGIEPNVSIDTWMSDSAKAMAESTEKAVNNVPESKDVQINASGNAADEAFQAGQNILNIPGTKTTNLFATDGARNEANQTTNAVNGVPDSNWTMLTASNNARTEAGQTTGAIAGIQDSNFTLLTASTNARTEAGQTTSAISGIQDSNFTLLTASSDARNEAGQTTNAIGGVQDSHSTLLTASADARLEAGATTDALNSIPTSVQVTITEVHEYVSKGMDILTGGGKASGGLVSSGVRGYATGGGLIGGGRPSNIYQDNMIAFIAGTGEPIALQSNEFITRGKQVQAGYNRDWLEWMNRGGVMHSAPRGFAQGGSLSTSAPRGFSTAPGVDTRAIQSAVHTGLSNATVVAVIQDPRVAASIVRQGTMAGGR